MKMRFRTIHDWCMWISSFIHVAYEVTFSKKYQKWSNNNNQILHFDRQKKITNWKKKQKSKSHDRTPCVLMYDLWCPEFTVRNDAVSYRISLMSNQKGLRQSPTNTDCLHERSRSLLRHRKGHQYHHGEAHYFNERTFLVLYISLSFSSTINCK